MSKIEIKIVHGFISHVSVNGIEFKNTKVEFKDGFGEYPDGYDIDIDIENEENQKKFYEVFNSIDKSISNL